MKLLRVLRWPLLTLTTLFLIALTAILINPQWVRVQTIQIELSRESNELLLFERIRDTIAPQLKKYENKFFWQVPLKQVFQAISKDKRVKSVAIFREFPSRLRIEIEPHTPVLGYLSRDGRIYPVATDATLLPGISPNDASDLPFLRGEELKDDLALREQALEIYAAFPNEGALLKKHLSEILYTKKDGFRLFVSGTGTEVRVGDSDFGPKLSRVHQVWSYLDSQNIKGRVIDARFSKKVVVRVRNTP